MMYYIILIRLQISESNNHSSQTENDALKTTIKELEDKIVTVI